MYKEFYELTGQPFQINPDPTFYFDSKQHRRAKAYLDYGVQRNEGFIVITGEIGAGKTTLLGSLLNSIHRDDLVVGHLVTTQLDPENMLRMVGAAFGFRVKDASKSELLITLEAFLIAQAGKGRRCLLIIDEAQNLTPRSLEELRMLSNYQLASQPLLQSFLVGQPEFRQMLSRPEMEQFRQRVAASCHIGPLDLEDTAQYIQHRLRLAGSKDKPQFAPGTYEVIHAATAGIPRRINIVCDRLLLQGYLSNRTLLEPSDAQEVAEELTSEMQAPATVNGARHSSGHITESTESISSSRLAPETADRLSSQLTSLMAAGHGDRMQRLEVTLQRLEQINLKTLSLLRELVDAMKGAAERKDR